MNSMRIAVVGCGAISERGHLPALQEARGVQVTLLVDRNVERASSLADRFGVERVRDDHSDVPQHADAAIVAVPHALHAPICIDLLSRGIHVLVEKPMALTSEECDRMIAAAQQAGVVLAVGLIRRFRWAVRMVRSVLLSGLIGRVVAFDVREGFVFDWPAASPSFLNKSIAGGGVLLDIGSHVLDALMWWLGDPVSVEYRDDCYGGVEADCLLNLTMQCGATGDIELSRTRMLRNTIKLQGTQGAVEMSYHANSVTINLESVGAPLAGNFVSPYHQTDKSQTLQDMMVDQLSDWINAVRYGCSAQITGEEGRRSVALIESCYHQRRPWILPWVGDEKPSRAVAMAETAT